MAFGCIYKVNFILFYFNLLNMGNNERMMIMTYIGESINV